MATKEFKKRWLATIYLMTLFTLYPGWCRDIVDMSESFLKLQEPVILYDLGEKGFAAYDAGDYKMKFFDWEFKQVNQFSLKKGEGPGEIKNFIVSTCIVEGKIYLLVLFDRNIKIFDQHGKYEKDITLDFMPRDFFFKKGSLYLLNLSINATGESFSLGAIIDPLSGKKTKDIFLKDTVFSPETFKGDPIMIGISSTFDVGNDGSVYLLISSANLLVAIDGSNRLKYKIDLPYKERKTMQTVKENGEESIVLSVLDWYPDMRAFDDGVYACFRETVKTGKKNDVKTYRTVVIKVFNKDEVSEKVFAGECVIIGQHKGILYLFNSGEYTVIPVKLSDWQKKGANNSAR
jgi:hypothetical protein